MTEELRAVEERAASGYTKGSINPAHDAMCDVAYLLQLLSAAEAALADATKERDEWQRREAAAVSLWQLDRDDLAKKLGTTEAALAERDTEIADLKYQLNATEAALGDARRENAWNTPM